jgi:hypothetical protein
MISRLITGMVYKLTVSKSDADCHERYRQYHIQPGALNGAASARRHCDRSDDR